MKYKLTNETITIKGIILHRIEACKSFKGLEGVVKKGDKGGFVENYSNLSQHGRCWIYDNAKVYQNASVEENASICEEVIVREGAIVKGHAEICDNVIVSEKALVFGYATIVDSACIYGKCCIYGHTFVSDHAKVYGSACISADAKISGKAHIYGNAHITDFSYISGTVEVFGNTRVDGNTKLIEDAKVSSNSDYQTFHNSWSSNRWFTWTKSNDMWSVGCFYGTGQELIDKAYKDSKESGDHYKLYVELVENLKKLD